MAVYKNNPPIVTNGLILNLDAANTKSYPRSGTTWTDLSGNLKTGTLTNGPTFNSINGGGISVDGVDDYIPVPNMVQTGLGFNGTIEIVTNCTGPLIFNERTSNSVGEGYFSVGASTNLTVAVDSYPNPPYTYGSTSTITGNVGSINYYAASYQIPSVTGTMSGIFCINGNTENFSNSMAFAGTNANYTTIDIGRARNFIYGTSYCSAGIIYTVRMYNRQLSTFELTQNYNALKSRFGL